MPREELEHHVLRIIQNPQHGSLNYIDRRGTLANALKNHVDRRLGQPLKDGALAKSIDDHVRKQLDDIARRLQ